MFKRSNNLPEVFLKSPDEVARCVRLRGGGVLRAWVDLTRPPGTCQFLPRDGGIPGEGWAGTELHRAGCRIHRCKQPGWAGRKDVLCTSRKIRGGEPLTWEWFTGEDEQTHQNLLQHPIAEQSQASINPAGSLHYCKRTKADVSRKQLQQVKRQGLPLCDKAASEGAPWPGTKSALQTTGVEAGPQ